MVRIAVIQHRRQRTLREHYGLGLVAEFWEAGGIEVVEVTSAANAVEADLAIGHVDLTFVPPDYQELLLRYPMALNARLTDISKRAFSRLVLRRGDPWDGPVVAKTNLNCLGSAEKQLVGRTGPDDPWRFVPLAISKHLRHRVETRWSALAEYRFLASVREVPDKWWDDDSIVIERFAAERDGAGYVVRRCVFLGDRTVNTAFRSAVPIARGLDLHDARRCDPPDELLRIREALGLDWGRLDYAIVDGLVVLYDVNRTPTFLERRPRLLEAARELADGIDTYLARGPRTLGN